MGQTLFVGGLSWNTDDASLRRAFARFGEISEATVVVDRESGRSRGFGFVGFADPAAAQAALRDMNGASLDGRTLRLNLANADGGDGPSRPPRGRPEQGFERPQGGGRPDGGRRGDGGAPFRGGRDGPRGPDRPQAGFADRGGPGPARGGPGSQRDSWQQEGHGQRGDGAGPNAEDTGYRGSRGASRGGWDLAPPADFGGGKRERPPRDDVGPPRASFGGQGRGPNSGPGRGPSSGPGRGPGRDPTRGPGRGDAGGPSRGGAFDDFDG